MAKQKFNGKTIYTKTAVDNIKRLAICHGDNRDKLWYMEAHKFGVRMCALYGVSIERTLGIIAALSPQKSWPENKRLAEMFLAGDKWGHTKAMLDKAQQIFECDNDVSNIVDILNGNKITAFFLNMLKFDTITQVTIDKHAIDIAIDTPLFGRGWVPSYSLTVKQYCFFQNAYIIAAEQLNMKPHEIQAITWMARRRLKAEVRNQNQ